MSLIVEMLVKSIIVILLGLFFDSISLNIYIQYLIFFIIGVMPFPNENN